jgi:hypothetical protein
MRIFLTIVLIVLAVAGCGRAVPPQHVALPDRYFVAEAALHYMCDQHSSSASEQDGHICYVIKKTEYAEQLLSSFSGYNPNFATTTNIETSADTGLSVDKTTGKAIKFWTVEVNEIHGDNAIAYVSWYSSRQGAGGHTIYLKRNNNKWVVVSEKMDWVS